MDLQYYALLLALLPIIALYLTYRSPARPLHNMVCVITGGAGEIGEVITRLLLARGVKVAVWDNNSGSIKRMRDKIGTEGVLYQVVDVSDCIAVQKAADNVIDQFSTVDILINSAALAHPFDIEESSVSEIEEVMRVNLLSHMWTIRTLLPFLRNSPVFNGLKGSVIGMASILGGVGTGGLQMYCSSKAGIIGLMESLYMQHPDLHWCIVSPFLVDTHLFRGMKHRFVDYFYPILDKHYVAKKIVEGIEYQKSHVSIPWFWNYFFILIKNTFPYPVLWFVQNLFDVRLSYLSHNSRL